MKFSKYRYRLGRRKKIKKSYKKMKKMLDKGGYKWYYSQADPKKRAVNGP